jgi:hypothetical protein
MGHRTKVLTSALVGVLLTPALGNAAADARPAGPGGLTVVRSWQGDQAGERFGWALATLSDVDGDRAREAVITVPGHLDADRAVTGHVDVRSGRTGRLLYRLDGAPGDHFGFAAADVGDVNGDGYADLAVGSTGSRALACVPLAFPGKVTLHSGRDGRPLRRIDGAAGGDQFGASVSGAGDVDRDGYADLVVGAPCHDGPAGADAGRGYLVSGRTGRVIRTHDGEAAGDGAGWGVAGLSDVDRDRRPDYAIAAKDAGPGDRGLAYVHSGRSGGLIRTLAGTELSQDFGWFFVADVGDVDGDRTADVYIGDFCADDPVGGCSSPRGHAYVFSGRTGERLHLFQGFDPGDGAGPGRGAGDVDRDGRPDIVVGSYLSSAAATNGGRITVYSGRTGRVLRDFASANAGETLGFDAVGIGDVTGDHRPDLLASGAIGDAVYIFAT